MSSAVLSRPKSRAVVKRKVTPPVVFDTRVVTGAGGGPDKTILNQPRFLRPLGYRNLCGYLYPPGDAGYTQIEAKASRYKAPLVSIPDRGPWDWRVVNQLLSVCRRENVAIWHGHDYKTNALGLLLRRFWPMKLVTTVHGWVHHTTRTPLYYKIDKFCLPRYDRVLCVSPDLHEAAVVCGVPPERCVLVENGIDTAEYTRKLSVADAKSKLGFPTQSLLVGAVGRLAPEKAFDLLVRSVHDLVTRGLDVRLVIVGDGDDRPRLEALIRELNLADRVTLAGWQGDVRAYFEAMDVFALSSLREGLPNVLLEAMALETPCVATRIAGIPRLISDGQNGLLVEAGDLAALTRSLAAIMTNAELRTRLAWAGRATIDARYSFHARMERIAMIYDELLGRRAARSERC
jgi:glycosyltransferase involved in cell wall biosynthesis